MSTDYNLQTYASDLLKYRTQNSSNQQIYDKVLQDNNNEIINALGGMQTIIQLCLTNPNAKNEIDYSHFMLLQSIMNKNNITLDTKDKKDNTHSNTSKMQHPANSNDMIISDLSQFRKTSIIFTADTQNNLYFRLFSDHIAEIISYNVLQTKWYPLTMISFIAINGVISLIYDTFYGRDMIYYIFLYSTYVACTIVTCSYTLSVNISIFKLIIERFDFWFKMYNVILFLTSWHWIIYISEYRKDHNAPGGIHSALTCLVSFSVFFWSFVLDGIAVSAKIKKIAILTLSIYCVVTIIVGYFTYYDVFWDPFESFDFKHTRINFKNIYLSSSFNLVLFVMKPIINDVVRCFRRKIGGKNKSINQNDGRGINGQNSDERCTTVFKRPYIHWKRKDVRAIRELQAMSSMSTPNGTNHALQMGV